MKEVIQEIIEILKDELARDHRFTDCGCDPEPWCLDGTGECRLAWKCTKSFKFEHRLNGLLEKLNKDG